MKSAFGQGKISIASMTRLGICVLPAKVLAGVLVATSALNVISVGDPLSARCTVTEGRAGHSVWNAEEGGDVFIKSLAPAATNAGPIDAANTKVKNINALNVKVKGLVIMMARFIAALVVLFAKGVKRVNIRTCVGSALSVVTAVDTEIGREIVVCA